LEKQGAQIAYHDPHVQALQMPNPGNLKSTPLTPEILGKADCVVILTDHSSYPYEEIVEQASLVVDCRNALGKRGICGRATVLTL
jgi:UDP-N-acetyl-D-glucosamine dehydrogenase